MIPLSLRRKIAEQSESEEERRNALVHYWLKTSPYASWQWLSGWCHYDGEESAVSAAKRYVQRAPGEHGSHDNYAYIHVHVHHCKAGRYLD